MAKFIELPSYIREDTRNAVYNVDNIDYIYEDDDGEAVVVLRGGNNISTAAKFADVLDQLGLSVLSEEE